MEENKSKPTIEDVAKFCGVSIATVSRVINQSSPVSEELTMRVRKAIKELGFTPRQWKDRSSAETIAMFVPDILNPFYAEVINGAQEEADRQGLNLVILNVSENPERQKQHLTLLAKWMFDGLIVMGTKLPAEALVEFYEQYNMPIVTSRSIETPEFPCIMRDADIATDQAMKYLIAMNHKRIAYVSGPPEWDSSKQGLEKVQRTLSDAGLTLPSHLYRWCYPNFEEGFQAVNSLLTLPKQERPTAIIAFNDYLAIGAIHAIHTARLRVPQDISVIGSDDIDIAAYITPPLTTISKPTYRIGQLAVAKLSELLRGVPSPEGGSTIWVKCHLILRESTGPCPE